MARSGPPYPPATGPETAIYPAPTPDDVNRDTSKDDMTQHQPIASIASTIAILAALASGCSKGAEEGPAEAEAQAAPVEAAEPAPEPAAPQPEPSEPAAEDTSGTGDAVAQNDPPAEKNCGGDDQPLCPLGQWMDDNTRVAAENGDLEAMAKAFHKIEFMAPDPSWNEGDDAWNKIARRGAVAAEEGELRPARKQCKACHDQWRDRYEEEYWHLEVPDLPANAEEGDPDLSL